MIMVSQCRKNVHNYTWFFRLKFKKNTFILRTYQLKLDTSVSITKICFYCLKINQRNMCEGIQN